MVDREEFSPEVLGFEVGSHQVIDDLGIGYIKKEEHVPLKREDFLIDLLD